MHGKEFQLIQGSDPFTSLQKDIVIPEHHELTQKVIFQQVQDELQQIETDIRSIFDTISNDVSSEVRQGELLDLKLKSTYKHLRHSYKKISNLRTRNLKYTLDRDETIHSKPIRQMETSIEKFENDLKDITLISDNIIENIVTINNRFTDQDDIPILSLDNLSEHQFPVLFKILKEQHPGIMTKRIRRPSKGHVDQEIWIDIDKTIDKPLPRNHEGGEPKDINQGNQLKKDEKSDRNKITAKFVNERSSSKISTSIAGEHLIPAFLPKKALPSTFIDLRNITNDRFDSKGELNLKDVEQTSL